MGKVTPPHSSLFLFPVYAKKKYAHTRTHCTHLPQEQEKVDLLESYQALSDEAEKLDSTVQHSLGETSTTRMELATLTQVGEIWKAVESPPLS